MRVRSLIAVLFAGGSLAGFAGPPGPAVDRATALALKAPAQPPSSPAGIALGWPLACQPGVDCWVQNYLDHDPGPGAKDYRCRSMTYDGHDGTDIRLPNLAVMRRGVAVMASAAGRVAATRDGELDIAWDDPAAPHTPGRNCGNAVIVEHQGGWRTVYCHMKKGSVRVKPGDAVAAGQPIGQVGLSGQTEFPHLHIGVERQRQRLDPFAPEAAPAACGAPAGSLWSAAVRAKATYQSPVLIQAGVAGVELTDDLVKGGSPPGPSRTGPLVAYAEVIGLEAGDTQALSLMAPDGTVLAVNDVPALDRAKARWSTYAGLRRPPKGQWAPGVYRAGYAVRRGGKLVLQRGWTVTIR